VVLVIVSWIAHNPGRTLPAPGVLMGAPASPRVVRVVAIVERRPCGHPGTCGTAASFAWRDSIAGTSLAEGKDAQDG
jgi:hypothetical protein